MSDRALICNKLQVLLKYYRELQEIAGTLTVQEYLTQLAVRRAVERQIQLIVETSTDVNNMILKHLHKQPSKDYFNSFIDLAENEVIDMAFALDIAPSTGLRNILVHEYTKIDDTTVYHSIQSVFINYRRYLKDVAAYLNCNME